LANVNFDIATLFQRAFGYNRGQSFDSGQIIPPQYLETAQYEGIDPIDETEYSKFRQMRLQLGGNILGQPLFMPIALEIPPPTTGGTPELVLLPNEPTIQINVAKIVVKTQMVGAVIGGTVKEFITLDDYQITIRGIALNTKQKKVYPEDDIYKIHELFLKHEAVSIKCGLTALLGINKVVIESFDLPSMIGVQHAQAYELKMISDRDWILTEE
jgi:hypothetical protein